MIKMYMDDDKQKEKTIIPSLGGVKDVSVGRYPAVFSFRDPKTRSFVIRGSSLIASAPKRLSLVDEELDP